MLIYTHLVLKRKCLSDISREAVYNYTAGLWNLHDLLLDLSYGSFLMGMNKYTQDKIICFKENIHKENYCIATLQFFTDWN